ncbi:hypothetical protein [Leptobacterium sp. I13]|uniref:hypothetical protein n=1 Tax=Leptobacterium meishanense TaxID=3128904 RepID=UPI0030EBE6FE
MKKIIFALTMILTIGMQAQTKSELVKHYEAYYAKMKLQGDVRGLINALTHLDVLNPSQATKDTLAYFYANGGQYVQALNTIGVDKNDSDSDLAVEIKAVSLKSINQPKRALEQYEVLFKRNPNSYIAYELSDLKIQTNDIIGAAQNIEYGLANAKDDMKYAFYETQNPYEVPIKAAFLHLKALIEFNKDNKNVQNMDTAIAIIDQALEIAPNFNLANLSKQALVKLKEEAGKPKE